MEALWRDLRYSLRSLARQPLLSLIAVATLALGIGANSAIFSVLDAVLLRPLPYRAPERLVTLWQDMTTIDGPYDEWTSWDNFESWRTQTESFDGMAAIGGWRPVLTGENDRAPEQLVGGEATHQLLRVLGTPVVHGRDFTAGDDVAGAEGVILISSGMFERRFGGDQTIIGTSMRFNSGPLRVVGVLPAGFVLPFVGEVEVLRPMAVDASNSCGRDCINMRVVARLAEGKTLSQAEAEMSGLARRLQEEFPAENAGVGSTVIALHERVTGKVRTPLLVLLGAVGFVLLIACANVASVQLARTLGRQSEFSLRLAIGANRRQLVQQLFTESVVLATLGGSAGLALAALGLRVLRSQAADMVPRLADASIDGATLVFTVLATLVTGLLFGTLPALRASGFELRGAMQQSSDSRGARRSRSALVVVEVALAVALLIGAGLLGRSLLELFHIDLGFDSERTLVARVSLSTETYRERANRVAFTERVVERLSALPGVTGVSHTTSPPLAGNDGDSGFEIEGVPAAEPGQEPVGWLRVVDADFFRTTGMTVVSGRGFTVADREGSPDAVVINEAAARRYWPEGNAVGQRINFNSTKRWREVVGIVGDTAHFGLTEPERPAVYLPWAQSSFGAPYFLVKTSDDPLSKVDALRTAVAEVDDDLAVAGITTLDELVGDASATEQLLVMLLGLFALIAVLLAAIGLYGVMSYAAVMRRREMGVRAALGAAPGTLRGMILREGLLLALLGAGLGLIVSVFLARLLASLLYGVGAYDALTWMSVPSLLVLVALLASWLPARRAAAIDVVAALHSD